MTLPQSCCPPAWTDALSVHTLTQQAAAEAVRTVYFAVEMSSALWYNGENPHVLG